MIAILEKTMLTAGLHFELLDELHRFLGLMFDEIDHGLFLLTAGGYVQYANSLALETLRTGNPLGLDDRRLTVQPVDRAVWQSGVSAACNGDRKLVFLGRHAHELPVSLMPLEENAGKSLRGLVLCLLGKRNLCEPLTLFAFATQNRLTRSEHVVLSQLVEGRSPAQMAAQLQVADSTVRSHIKAILAKTQAGGIRELLLTVTKLPPVLPRIKPVFNWEMQST